MKFKVIDNSTGAAPDMGEIARTEDWAYGLIWYDMEGFFIAEDGDLMLADETGNWAWCPKDRFQILFEGDENNGV